MNNALPRPSVMWVDKRVTLTWWLLNYYRIHTICEFYLFWWQTLVVLIAASMSAYMNLFFPVFILLLYCTCVSADWINTDCDVTYSLSLLPSATHSTRSRQKPCWWRNNSSRSSALGVSSRSHLRVLYLCLSSLSSSKSYVDVTECNFSNPSIGSLFDNVSRSELLLTEHFHQHDGIFTFAACSMWESQ